MEGTQSQLCTRLADGLCRDDSDDFALLDHAAGGEVASVALGADALAALAGQHGADLHLLDRKRVDEVGLLLADFFSGLDDELTRERVEDIVHGGASENPLSEGFHDFVLVLDGCGDKSAERAAVLLVDDHIV